ncbi:hypothetical protein FJT64_024507 [Amphibalanus amphitrite]|uniref:Uncharacterized protein n=1 Tax=Amphibalanus amphitrite TaxID=1232801 RepID=A0A6A4W6U9_AMPAM|nr:hypothetical protein FJT64_024507 [Amphibalanus amphitrite]
MQFREMQELAAMTAKFSVGSIKDIKPEEFIGFGMKDSHDYREMFMEATKTMDANSRTWVIILATAVKNRERILVELNTKFLTAPWRNTVQNFFMTKTVTKNSDNVGPEKLMPVQMKVPAERTYENFVGNQWVAQLYVSDDVLADQREYEEDLWENQITKGGRTYERGFQEKYWLTKSKDWYPLLMWNMTSDDDSDVPGRGKSTECPSDEEMQAEGRTEATVLTKVTEQGAEKGTIVHIDARAEVLSEAEAELKGFKRNLAIMREIE